MNKFWRKISSCLVITIMFIAMLPYAAFANETSDNDVITEIDSAEDLISFRDSVNNGNEYEDTTVRLLADINLSAAYSNTPQQTWIPIGTYEHQFKGTFEGGGNTIKGIDIDTGYCLGLFGYVGSGGEVKDIIVSGTVTAPGDQTVASEVSNETDTEPGDGSGQQIGGSIMETSGYYIGGIAGYNEGVLTNCISNVEVSGKTYVGGITGYNRGTVINCENRSKIKAAAANSGGVVGWSTGTVEGCSNDGEVTGGQYVGGIVGQNYSGKVTGCGNSGVVFGQDDVGGVIGYSFDNVDSSIDVSICFNTGKIGCDTGDVGGVVGNNKGSFIENCYNAGDITGGKAGGVVGQNEGNQSYTGRVSHCHNVGNVSSASGSTGEICGINTDNTEFLYCYYQTEGYTDEGTAGMIGKTEDAFKSGEVAYLLNDNKSEGVWGQNIGEDAYPNFTGMIVYSDGDGYFNEKFITTTNNVGATYGQDANGNIDESTQATGFITTVSGMGTFNRITWNVTGDGLNKKYCSKDSKEGTETTFTLKNSEVSIGLIIDGLYDHSAHAEATVEFVNTTAGGAEK